MALWDQVKTMMAMGAPMEPVQTRSIDPNALPDIDRQLLRIQGLRTSPWRAASIREALGTPAIFRAVSLIANTTGSLAVETYRRGVKLDDDDSPAIVKRPDPFRTPRVFYRDSAYHLATRGECWWWVAKRDSDGYALSLIVVPPWEVNIEPTKDRLRPIIRWLDREMPREDMRQITFLPDEGGYRGVGPLQLCGAAVSVAVEAQEWAANFFGSGGNPSIIIKAKGRLAPHPETGVHEAKTLLEQWTQDVTADSVREGWLARPNNEPRVIDEGIEDVKEFGVNVQGAQMLDSRQHENGNAARMFGIPGSLLEYQQAGSSLTYQNLEGEFTKFVKASLAPGYLEPIEQEMSDLLPRSTVSRFAVKGFLRADQKTRWETYKLASEVLGQEEAANLAREAEGIVPGDIEFAPVPFLPPAAVPTQLPIRNRSVDEIRCDGRRMRNGRLTTCGKLLAPDWRGRCPRCKKEYEPAA